MFGYQPPQPFHAEEETEALLVEDGGDGVGVYHRMTRRVLPAAGPAPGPAQVERARSRQITVRWWVAWAALLGAATVLICVFG